MYSDACRHCGQTPEADGDHTCPCPHPDGLCPEHDQAPDDVTTIRCSCGPHAIVHGTVPDPGCPFHGR